MTPTAKQTLSTEGTLPEPVAQVSVTALETSTLDGSAKALVQGGTSRCVPERWKTVEQIPVYEISDWGRLRRKPNLPGGHSGIIKHIQVCPKGGYLQYRVRINTKKSARYIHRLVAEAFVEGRVSGLQVHHIDGDKLNNHWSNLKWVSVASHKRHHVTHDVVGKQFGSWTILHRLYTDEGVSTDRRGRCIAQCTCGRKFNRSVSMLVRGASRECRWCSNAKKARTRHC